MTWWQPYKLSRTNTRDKNTQFDGPPAKWLHNTVKSMLTAASRHFCDGNFHGCNSAYLQQLWFRRPLVNYRFLQAAACVVLTLLSRLCSLWAVHWVAECRLAPSSSLLLLLPCSSLSFRQLQPQTSTWPLAYQCFNVGLGKWTINHAINR